jgi:hypothetical protein
VVPATSFKAKVAKTEDAFRSRPGKLVTLPEWILDARLAGFMVSGGWKMPFSKIVCRLEAPPFRIVGVFTFTPLTASSLTLLARLLFLLVPEPQI